MTAQQILEKKKCSLLQSRLVLKDKNSDEIKQMNAKEKAFLESVDKDKLKSTKKKYLSLMNIKQIWKK